MPPTTSESNDSPKDAPATHGGNKNSNTSRPKFSGNTPGMNGNVFLTPAEHGHPKQFRDAVQALREYTAKNLKYPTDLNALFGSDSIECPEVPYPEAVPQATLDADPRANYMFQETMKQYVLRNSTVQQNLVTLYAVVWGQCSPAMQARIEGLSGHASARDTGDVVWLLNEVLKVTSQFDSRVYIAVGLDKAHQNFRRCRQARDESTVAFYHRFSSLAQTLQLLGGSFGEDPALIAFVRAELGSYASAAEVKATARQRALAVSFLNQVDPSRFGSLLADLANQDARGVNQYPDSLASAYELVSRYQAPTTSTPASSSSSNSNGNNRHKNNKSTKDPKEKSKDSTKDSAGATAGQTGQSFFQPGHVGAPPSPPPPDGLPRVSFSFARTPDLPLPPSWVLLDSQSTDSVFSNRDLLTDIISAPAPLTTYSNGGSHVSHYRGVYGDFGPVWYNPTSLANILSLAEVSERFRVTMDTADSPSMTVHLPSGPMTFVKHNGLFHHDTNGSTPGSAKDSNVVAPYSFLSTVRDHEAQFTKRELRGAQLARALYRKLGRPSERDFYVLLEKGLISNCPITPVDARRATYIYGPDLASLKGKTTRRHPKAVLTPPVLPVPADVLAHHRNVTLCADVFFVQGAPFLHTISRSIKFRTVVSLPSRSASTLLKHMREVLGFYTARGFQVTDALADLEFAPLQPDLLPTRLDICAADSHVGEVERSIRAIKERVRATVQGLPYQRLPRAMVRALVEFANRSLNLFPPADGVSDTMSPRMLVTGLPNPDYRQCKLEFGAYVQVFEDNLPSNTTKARTRGAIALYHTGNAAGDYFFMSLTTGTVIQRHQWTELPITDDAIARVHELAIEQNQPLLEGDSPRFEWSPNQPLDGDDESDDDEDSDDEYSDDEDSAYDPANADLADDPDDDLIDDGADAPVEEHNDPYEPFDQHVVEHNDVAPTEADGHMFDAPDDEGAPADDGDTGAPPADGAGPDEGAHGDGAGAAATEGATPDADAGPDGNVAVPDEGAPHDDGVVPDEGAVPYEGAPHDGGAPANPASWPVPYNLRPSRGRDYSHRYGHSFLQFAAAQVLNQLPAEEIMRGIVLTQMSARAGIKKHGAAAEAALLKEFRQLEEKGVFEALDPATLTDAQKAAALRAVNLIKEKRTGELKGRSCADGRPQRALYDRSQTASPAVALDALLAKLALDAHEARDVASADVTGAYLNADMPDFVLMKLTGADAQIFARMHQKYARCLTKERGVSVLYVRLAKALYGCVTSALLWYRLFRDTLLNMGFELNPYDPCVANAMIDGAQCTIAWYVDDTVISHRDPNVVSRVIADIERHFGKMTVTRGKQHTFLGMDIELRPDGNVALSMVDYISDAIAVFGEDVSTSASTPAATGLYTVRDNVPLLSPSRKELYRSVVAKLLYIAQRARPDTLPTVAFLCTRADKATTQDWGKLKRLLQYLHGTLRLPRIFGVRDLGTLHTWVDASYAVHGDMRSHTGGAISLGHGTLTCKSTKQKLNTKSSTEAEIVGASDFLPNTIWLRMFLEAQGYPVTENLFYQDNMSAIHLAKNGRLSAGQKSRHIDIRHFFITDRIDSERLKIRHCPTEQMLADFFTKPLQGALFHKHRDVILGLLPLSALAAGSEERVEEAGTANAGTTNAGQDGKASASRSYADVVRSRSNPTNAPSTMVAFVGSNPQ